MSLIIYVIIIITNLIIDERSESFCKFHFHVRVDGCMEAGEGEKFEHLASFRQKYSSTSEDTSRHQWGAGVITDPPTKFLDILIAALFNRSVFLTVSVGYCCYYYYVLLWIIHIYICWIFFFFKATFSTYLCFKQTAFVDK